MYRPERVIFCVGASLYPVEDHPHVAGVEYHGYRGGFANHLDHRGDY